MSGWSFGKDGKSIGKEEYFVKQKGKAKQKKTCIMQQRYRQMDRMAYTGQIPTASFASWSAISL